MVRALQFFVFYLSWPFCGCGNSCCIPTTEADKTRRRQTQHYRRHETKKPVIRCRKDPNCMCTSETKPWFQQICMRPFMFCAEFGRTKDGVVASASGMLVASVHACCSQQAWGQSRPWTRAHRVFQFLKIGVLNRLVLNRLGSSTARIVLK